jgi:DnaJ family protein B protein 6
MENGDDPYQILGVSREATEGEIKKAYRKLALKHHPDKQTTEEARQQASAVFAKISNAYEILSDQQKRQEYDNRGRYQNNFQSSSHRPGRDPRGDFGFSGMGGGRHPFQFHDPFELFNRVFQEEFGRMGNMRDDGFGSRSGGFGGSPFGSMMGGSMFDDPFFGGGMGHPMGNQRQSNSFFGGGGFGGDPFAMMQQSMMGGGPGNGTTSSFSMSSSNFPMGGNGVSTSTSTTTRIVNGRRQTVRETIIRKADGTVERKVETEGDGDIPLHLEQGQSTSMSRFNRGRRY